MQKALSLAYAHGAGYGLAEAKCPTGVTLRPEPVAVALGSNLGDSLATLTWAASALKPMAEDGLAALFPLVSLCGGGGVPPTSRITSMVWC